MHEVRIVLPSAAVAHSRPSGLDALLLPTVLGYDIPLPETLALAFGGFGRVRVCTSAFGVARGGDGTDVYRGEYRCTLPLLPVALWVCLYTTIVEGDCTEENALGLRPEDLGRDVERFVLGEGDVATVYSRVELRLALRAAGLTIPWRSLAVRGFAHALLHRHWQSVVRALAREPDRERRPCPLSPAREESPDSPRRGPEPLGRGLPLHKGFLYKLGDGYLNTAWNLRYFLLIGPSLQYYRSQHEARPRDTVNVQGAFVEWVSESRPFTFTVCKSGQRTMCLSGQTEQEAREWVERIEAASRLGSGSCAAALPTAHQEAERDELEAEARLQACARLLSQAATRKEGGAFSFVELRQGLRIRSQSSPPASAGPLLAAAAALLPLLAVAPLLGPCGAAPCAEALLRGSLACLAVALALGTALRVCRRGEVPSAACATVRLECSSEDLREVLADPGLRGEWDPDHVEGHVVSLAPSASGDELVHLRFRCLGLPCDFRARRRWMRGEGARLLCSASEGPGAWGYEGFVLEERPEACLVTLVCALELPWAPGPLQRELVRRRVSALAGLREWLQSPRAKASSRRFRGQAPRGLRRAASGLLRRRDLDRAALLAELLGELLRGALLGRRSCAASAGSGGPLPERYAARWAYASLFLVPEARPRERLAAVAAFLVAGLHLLAASSPHLPWQGQGGSVSLPDDSVLRLELQRCSPSRRAAFELLGPGAAFRVSGREDAACRLEGWGLSFRDRGSTLVELGPHRLRFTLPELRVRPSGWPLGMGSLYEWHGPAHILDEESGFHCSLLFGRASPGRASDTVTGSLRDTRGMEVGEISGGWLTRLAFDGELLWHGPAQQGCCRF